MACLRHCAKGAAPVQTRLKCTASKACTCSDTAPLSQLCHLSRLLLNLRMMQVDSRLPLWAALAWAAASAVRWQRARPVLGPLLDLWWEDVRWGHRRVALHATRTEVGGS